MSSVWNFCSRVSAVTLRGSQWWRCEMFALFTGYYITVMLHTSCPVRDRIVFGIPLQKKIIHSLYLFIFQVEELKSNWLKFKQLPPITHHFPHGVWFLNSNKDRLVVKLTGGAYNIYFQGKLEILVGKSNGLCYYIWEALENMGPDLRGSKFFCSFPPVQLIWIQ